MASILTHYNSILIVIDSLSSALSFFNSLLTRNVKAVLMATMTAAMLKDSRVGLIIVFNTCPAIKNSRPEVSL